MNPILAGVLLILVTACGQRGPLVLPSDQQARTSKAVYLIDSKRLKPRKAAGEVDPAAQQPLTAQPVDQHPGAIN